MKRKKFETNSERQTRNTEVVGVSVKYMLCGGAVVYAHDLKPA